MKKLFIVLLALAGCSKDDPKPVAATVLTNEVLSIKQTTVTVAAKLESNGGSTVIKYGVVWGTAANPVRSIGNYTENDGEPSGLFFEGITGLTSNTTYHVRAYAINSTGPAYGADLVFTTLKTPAKIEVVSMIPSQTSYDSYSLIVTVKNTGETTGYNVSVTINALQGSTIVDTATAFPANLNDILPGQSAQDEAVFFDLTPDQAKTVTFSTPAISWLSKD